jgi:hypothetical protein
VREMTRSIRNLKGGGENELNIVFVLIGYADHDPSQPPPPPPTASKAWILDGIHALLPNDVFAPFLGLYHGMDAHEAHLAREMKLTGQKDVIHTNPYLSRLDDNNPYAALVLCPGELALDGRTTRYEPPMDWTLSAEAKRYIENALIPGSGACAAEANAKAIDAIVDALKR